MNAKSEVSYIPELDGLRGVAVLLVVLFHLDPVLYISEFHIFYDKVKLTKIGVSLFFVLSGFLITRILISKPVNLKEFWLKRFWRIFPLYYMALIVVFLIYPGNYILPALLYYYNYWGIFNATNAPIGPFWSLSVEEHFYLFWPFLIKYFNNKTIRAFFVVFAVSVVTTMVTPLLFEDRSIVKGILIEGTLAQMMIMSFGCLFAIYERHLEKQYFYYLAWFILILSTLCLIYDVEEINRTQKYLFRNMFYAGVAVGFFLVCLNVKTRTDDSLLGKMLRHQSITYIGVISYGVYVTHYIVFKLFQVLREHENSSSWLFAAAALAVTIAISHLSFFYFERPLARYGRSRIASGKA